VVNPGGVLRTGTKAAGAAATALALAVTAIAHFEGKVNNAHWDRYGKIYDVCYGETSVPMRHYSDEECLQLLRQRAGGFLEGVRARNPAITYYPHQWAAHSSFAYNVGLANYDRSSVAALFAQGKQADACRFMGRYVYAGGVKLPGLVNRRAAETKLCLEDAT
jgi:lysozyme